MGRIFLEHIGGNRLYSCANCDTVLTNRSELISTRFNGSTGRAYLFSNVVNFVTNEVQERVSFLTFFNDKFFLVIFFKLLGYVNRTAFCS